MSQLQTDRAEAELGSGLELASRLEVSESLLATSSHGLLSLSDPDTGVEELLVGLVSTVRVADLSHEVVLLVEDVVTDTKEVGPLRVSVHVHLDHTVLDGSGDLVLLRARATVEHEEADGNEKGCKGQ